MASPLGPDLSAAVTSGLETAVNLEKFRTLKSDNQRQNILQANMPQALEGDPNALRSITTADPESGMKIQQFIQNADKSKLERANQSADILGRMATLIGNAPDNEIVQAYAWGLDNAKKAGIDISQAPRTSDPVQIRNYMKFLQAQAVSVKDQMTINKPPSSVQEYNYGLQNPGFKQYQEEMKKAGATRVNVDARGQQLSPLWELTKDRIKNINTQLQNNSAITPALEKVVNGLEGGVETGRVKDYTRPIRQIANELGIKIDPKLPQEEMVKAAMSYIIPRMRVVGSGSSSDFEGRQFTAAAPNFQNTREGNILIARGYLQQQKYLQNESDLLKEYAMQHGGSDVGFQDYARQKLGRLFPEPQSDAEYQSLEKGTVYIDPEGQYRVKGAK